MTFTATVSAVAPGSGTPAGTVSFTEGAATLGTGALDGTGHATLATSALAAGRHAVTANYAVSADDKASTSPPLTQLVQTDIAHPITVTPTVSLKLSKPDPCSSNYPPACSIPTTVTVSASSFHGDPGAKVVAALCNGKAATPAALDGSGGGDRTNGCDYADALGLAPAGVAASGTLTLDASGNLPGNLTLQLPSNKVFRVVGGGASPNPDAVCPPTATQVNAGWTCMVSVAQYDPANLGATPNRMGFQPLYLKSPIPTVRCGGAACPSPIPSGTAVTLTGTQFLCKVRQADDPTTPAYDGACLTAWNPIQVLLKYVASNTVIGPAVNPTSFTSSSNGSYTLTFTMPSVGTHGQYKLVPHAPTCSAPCDTGKYNAAGALVNL